MSPEDDPAPAASGPPPISARGEGVRIAVDAMGGDHGATEVVPGAIAYATANPRDSVILVGDTPVIERLAPALPANVRVVHASEVIGMDEHPARALREKKDASILVATDLVRKGDADAVVTAGHTGAGMAAAVLRLGRLKGVDRPGLAIQIPSGGRPFVLLDIGANPDSTAENLAQYARMGAIFSERVLGVERPRVALLSIGEEKGKGEARVQRATELIDEINLNFVGNVEGKDLTRQMADVVVCDAVLGNVVIKFFEGLSGFIFDLFRAEFRGSLRGRLAYLLLRPGIGRIRHVFDYEVVGGSPLLGVRGAVIITHGRAKRRMIEHAVRVGATTARERVPERIADALAADALAEAQAGLEDSRGGPSRARSDVDEALAATAPDDPVADGAEADRVAAREAR
ncbi:MAG TPA: phosphate acyltransferase PlsX [Candidatus Limnocylindrales bacterium]|nr:phosphate acyltransferase PlsX [Candidatus Limnocylindrales bacterium]